MMNRAVLARQLHKWIALVVGVQALLWVVSGFYMVVVDLDFIHGDPLVRNLSTPPPRADHWLPLATLRERYDGMEHVRIKGLPGFDHALYEIRTGRASVLVDAETGEQLSPLTAEHIAGLATAYYAGSGALESPRLLVDNPPLEIQTRPLPLWRADFDDWLATSLYLHPDTGELVTRRHRFWRWFDVFWMLHIMDYDAREDVNNGLLRTSTLISVALAGSGLWLVYYSFRRRRRAAGS
jgi:hypothetical protein